MDSNSDITSLLQRIDSGDGEAAYELFPLVYEELRRLARWKLSTENASHTLQPTALVNEAYLRLVGHKTEVRYRSRRGFFVAAAEAMRHILVDAARRKMAQKRGGTAKREPIDVDYLHVERPAEVLGVHEALDALAAQDPQCAEMVKLHYFGGHNFDEVADLLGVSRSTINRWWVYSKAFLRSELE